MSKRDDELKALSAEATAVTLGSLDLARKVRCMQDMGADVEPSLAVLVSSLNQRSAAVLGQITDRQIARANGRVDDALVASMEYLDARKFAAKVRRRRTLDDMRRRLNETRERMVAPAVPEPRPMVASISDDFVQNKAQKYGVGMTIPVYAGPGTREARSRAANASRRRQCKECGYVSNAMGVGKHQIRTKHRGLIALPPVVLNKTKIKPWLSKTDEDGQTIV